MSRDRSGGSVGIAIPAYGRGSYLAATLESVLAQTRHAAEIVVVDDCSPDNTADVARAYEGRGVRLVRNPKNVGVPENYNVSLGLLKSDYVLILEDHDLLEPTFVEQCAAVLDAHPNVNLVFTSIAEMDESDVAIRENHFRFPAIVSSRRLSVELVSVPGAIFGLTAMVRRTALSGLEPYFHPQYWAYADIYLWIRLAMQGDAGYVPDTLLKMRVREAGHHLEGKEWKSLLCVDRIKRDCWPLVFPRRNLESLYRAVRYRLTQDRIGLQQIVADIARGRGFRLDRMPDEVRGYFTPLARVPAQCLRVMSSDQARCLRRLYRSLIVAPVIGTRRLRPHNRTP
jgi:glycosyltransferase involved in cell wall biosynthesis